MNLMQTIEEFDPGHFSRRKDILRDLCEKVKELGFFPLPLTPNDIECFWVTLEPNDSFAGKKIHLSEEDLDYIDIFKGVASYNGTE